MGTFGAKQNKVTVKWTNRMSGETGYVRDINTKEKHFDNTFDADEARRFGNAGAAASAIRTLQDYGEGRDNDFEIVRE